MTQIPDLGLPAVVLAGGRPNDQVAASQGKPVKALAELNGRPLVSYVVEALSGAGVRPIWVATSVAAAADMHAVIADSAQMLATAEPNFTDTLLLGLTAAGDVPAVLLCTGDLPLLTPEAVADFVDRARATGAEVVYSAVSLDDLKPPYDSAVRVKVKLREGPMSGGNMVLAKPSAMRNAIQVVQKTFAGRKSPMALLRLFGPMFVVRYLTGTLDVPRLRERGSAILGCRVDVVISHYPEVCFDIDHPGHLDVARAVLALHGKAGQ